LLCRCRRWLCPADTPNIYGSKQAGQVWFLHLAKELKSIGFTQLTSFPTIFVRGSCIYVLYMDDSILTGPNCKDLLQVVDDLKAAGLHITVEGNIMDFLGVNISKDSQGKQHPPHTAAAPWQHSQRAEPRSWQGQEQVHTSGSQQDPAWPLRRSSFWWTFPLPMHHWQAELFGKSTRPDISFAAHQVARFSADPKQPHADAVKWLGCYLKVTCDKGLVLWPTSESFDVYVDADFARNWNMVRQKNKLHCSIKAWLHHHVCWLPSPLGFSASNWNCPKYHWKQV